MEPETVDLKPNFSITLEFLAECLANDTYESKEARVNAVASLIEHTRFLARTDVNILNNVLKRFLDRNV